MISIPLALACFILPVLESKEFVNVNKEHKHNILKECLKSWTSNENYKFAPDCLNIKHIYINPENDDKMFIVSTNKDWLKSHGLESIINNELFVSSTYLSTFGDRITLTE